MCSAGSRLLVQESVREPLLAGDRPHRPQHGARRSARSADDAWARWWMRRRPSACWTTSTRAAAKARAWRSAASACARSSGGCYIEPTIFDGVQPQMRIAREEIFGPVLSALSFRDLEQALRIANDVSYGLAAAVWTRDITTAHRAARALARRRGVRQLLRCRRHHGAVRRLQAVGLRPRQVAARLRQVHRAQDHLDRSGLSAAEHAFVATVPRGLADLLARELRLARSGANARARCRGGVQRHARDRLSRLPVVADREPRAAAARRVRGRERRRVLREVRAFDWSAHIDPARTLACEFTGTHPTITHTPFRRAAAQGRHLRPPARRHRHAAGCRAVAAGGAGARARQRNTRDRCRIDLAGEGLHRRGYRSEAGEAPLRENLAAGVLLRARWPEAAERGAEFLDPMCGSGTLVIEAAMIAARRAPGLRRDYFGFLGWKRPRRAAVAAAEG